MDEAEEYLTRYVDLADLRPVLADAERSGDVVVIEHDGEVSRVGLLPFAAVGRIPSDEYRDAVLAAYAPERVLIVVADLVAKKGRLLGYEAAGRFDARGAYGDA